MRLAIRDARWSWCVAPVFAAWFLVPAAVAEDPKAPVTTVAVDRTQESWVKRQESINARAKQGDVDLVFLGDSITQGWEGAGKAAWEKHYASRKAMNAGIGGDGTQHVLWRLDHGNVDGINPKALVLMIGTNNAPGETSSAADIAAGVKAVVEKLREKLPKTKVLVLGIFPSGEKSNPHREKTRAANAIIAGFADGKNVHYLDISREFMNDDESISKEIMPDFLHLSPAGYDKWAAAIEAKLSELLGEKKPERQLKPAA